MDEYPADESGGREARRTGRRWREMLREQNKVGQRKFFHM